MSMLEKMARELALNAVERVKPDTYTNVVDEIWLYLSGIGKYRVSDYPGIYSETPVLSSTEAFETMVAIMAEQAGAIVVVPDDAPMDSHLAQIAQLLVASADVPTDAQDVADGAAIVQTVKRALDYLDAARDDNHIKYERIEALKAEASSNKVALEALKATEARLNNEIARWRVGANELQDKYLAAQLEIGALTARLETAQRSIRRGADEAVNWQGRYEGLSEALAIVLEKAGVGK